MARNLIAAVLLATAGCGGGAAPREPLRWRYGTEVDARPLVFEVQKLHPRSKVARAVAESGAHTTRVEAGDATVVYLWHYGGPQDDFTVLLTFTSIPSTPWSAELPDARIDVVAVHRSGGRTFSGTSYRGKLEVTSADERELRGRLELVVEGHDYRAGAAPEPAELHLAGRFAAER